MIALLRVAIFDDRSCSEGKEQEIFTFVRLIQRLFSIDFCAELGAHMVVHSPLDFLGTSSQRLSPYAGFDLLEIVHSTLDEAVAYATSIQCALGIETIYDRHPNAWMEMVKSFDSKYVRASMDVGHTFINDQLGAPPPDY